MEIIDKLKFGWSEVDITPKQKIKLAGQFFERITDEVETPITVTALAIDSGDDQMVICSCDLCGVGKNLIELVREKINGIKDLDASKIILAATHTHTSYLYETEAETESATLNILDEYLPPDKKYKEHKSGEAMDLHDALVFLADKIAEAINNAWESRDYGYYANEFGRAAIGMCRRVVYDDGSAAMWGDANKANFVELEGGNDSGIELIYFFNGDKKLKCVLINVACPSQVVEQRSFISSDYWGKVKILLRKEFGDDICVLGLVSPAGDQAPRDMIRWIEPESPIDDPNIEPRKLERKADPSMFDVAGTWKIGKRIAHEVIDAYEEAVNDMADTAVFSHEVQILKLPLRRVTMKDYNEAVLKIKEFFRSCPDEIDYNDNAAMHVYAGTVARYKEQQTMDLVPTEVHTARLGDVAFGTNPFELFLDYANKIRARSYAKQTVLMQLTQGAYGYLPTEKAERGSHYSAYVSSGIIGHDGGEQLVRETLSSINEKFKA